MWVYSFISKLDTPSLKRHTLTKTKASFIGILDEKLNIVSLLENTTIVFQFHC